MNLSQLYALIRQFEGLRLRPYLCPAGVATIGYGTTSYPDGHAVQLGDAAVTPEQADELMAHDAEICATAALKLSPILAHDSDRLCAIADFIYNLGTTRYKASTLRRCVNQADWDGAREQLAKWVWGGGRKLSGLVARRAAEAALI